ARTWCIANPLAKPAALKSDVDRLCGGDVDCSSIQSGGVCFAPNTVADHASVVYNIYYKSHQSQPSACSFGDNTLSTVSDPCKFPSLIIIIIFISPRYKILFLNIIHILIHYIYFAAHGSCIFP
ncbi:hypothetical protein BHM03_00037629, partial [Ensete ventricosum]